MIYIGIGSNLGNKLKNIEKAKSLIKINGINIIQSSSYYETLSWPDATKPKFLNIGLLADFNLDYLSLLNEAQLVEKKIGRFKSTKNEPRVCDIDIIDFNGKIINENIIKLPHPRSHNRNFVLYPIKEIDPVWMHPVLKKNVDILISELSQFSRNEITRLNKSVIMNA